MSHLLRMTFVVVGSILLATSSNAQNLAPNPELDVDDEGWDAESGSIVWIDQDANGCELEALSGGLELTSTDESLPRVQVTGGCFPVTASQNICFSMDYVLGADLTMIGVTYFTDAACENGTGGGAYIGGPGDTKQYVTIHSCSTVPGDINSAKLRVDSLDFDGTEYTLVADRFYAGEADRVYIDDFATESLCRWSLTVP